MNEMKVSIWVSMVGKASFGRVTGISTVNKKIGTVEADLIFLSQEQTRISIFLHTQGKAQGLAKTPVTSTGANIWMPILQDSDRRRHAYILQSQLHLSTIIDSIRDRLMMLASIDAIADYSECILSPKYRLRCYIYFMINTIFSRRT